MIFLNEKYLIPLALVDKIMSYIMMNEDSRLNIMLVKTIEK